ncbi:MAG: YqgE/AlgH family protein [Proteobacteria bacterium]|nr:YqgE/AlgH family protein [Desulfobulbaceae bacterium]MBU4151469.1 YqgE/AlgH family protein [Pseudomonadota bacterium]
MESLKGTFLLATPQMPDPRFKEQIIYLCSHDENGAMGFVFNKPSPHSLDDILKSANIEAVEGEWPPVYIGGPVDGECAFFLYSADYMSEHSLDVGEGIMLSRNPEILHDIARGTGPLHYIFLLGYAGWGPGQLEMELGVNGWLSLPAEQSILFETPDRDKWHKAAQRFGIDIVLFNDQIGSA